MFKQRFKQRSGRFIEIKFEILDRVYRKTSIGIVDFFFVLTNKLPPGTFCRICRLCLVWQNMISFKRRSNRAGTYLSILHISMSGCFEFVWVEKSNPILRQKEILKSEVKQISRLCDVSQSAIHLNQKEVQIMMGCHHSCVDFSAPSILPPRVRVLSTPSKLSSIY